MIVRVESYTKVIRKACVLDDVDATFESGKIYALRGINGSGKTMLLRAIAGLIRPTSGLVKVDGEVIGKDIDFPRNVGILIESPAFIEKYTGYQNLKILADIRKRIGREEIVAALREVDLDPFDKRPFKKYSLGMKQRLGIACAIMERPELILLDEPLNSLDDSGVLLVRKVLESIRDKGSLIILATHDTYEFEGLIDETLIIDRGRILPGPDMDR